MGKIEELNEPKTCSQALIHPAWDDLLSLLGLYGIETMDRVGLIDTSYDEADIRWNYIVDNKYVLRLTNAPEMTEERLADLNRLIARYGEFGLRCPAFIRGTDGLFFHSWGALTAYLSEYVDLPTADPVHGAVQGRGLEPHYGDVQPLRSLSLRRAVGHGREAAEFQRPVCRSM